MALSIFPSSFKCDCGHQSDFSENTVRELKELSLRSRKVQVLCDSETLEHNIVFRDGEADVIICPDLGECSITGDDIKQRQFNNRVREPKQSPVVKFTPKQGRYLAFIDHYTTLNGVAPAEADMQAFFRTSAPSVHQMVDTLERNSLISRTPGVARSIQLLVPRHRLPDLKTGEASTLTVRHSHVAVWLKTSGCSIELGYCAMTRTSPRAFCEDAMVWSGGSRSDTLDDLLAAVDAGIASVIDEWQ